MYYAGGGYNYAHETMELLHNMIHDWLSRFYHVTPYSDTSPTYLPCSPTFPWSLPFLLTHSAHPISDFASDLDPYPAPHGSPLGVLAPTWTSSQLPGVYSPISSYPSYPTIILSYLPLIMYFDLRLVCNPASHCSPFVFLSSPTMPRVYPFVLTDFNLCSDFGFHLV